MQVEDGGSSARAKAAYAFLPHETCRASPALDTPVPCSDSSGSCCSPGTQTGPEAAAHGWGHSDHPAQLQLHSITLKGCLQITSNTIKSSRGHLENETSLGLGISDGCSCFAKGIPEQSCCEQSCCKQSCPSKAWHTFARFLLK